VFFCFLFFPLRYFPGRDLPSYGNLLGPLEGPEWTLCHLLSTTISIFFRQSDQPLPPKASGPLLRLKQWPLSSEVLEATTTDFRADQTNPPRFRRSPPSGSHLGHPFRPCGGIKRGSLDCSVGNRPTTSFPPEPAVRPKVPRSSGRLHGTGAPFFVSVLLGEFWLRKVFWRGFFFEDRGPPSKAEPTM